MLVITGTDGINVKPANVPVPSGDVTETLPDAPSEETVAVIIPGEATRKFVAGTPPKLTSVVPVKFVPVMTTVCPAPALAGIMDVIRGDGKYINPPNEAEPPGVVTEIWSPAFAGTTAVICVAETTVKLVAGRPPKLTALAPVKFAPVIVTTPPGSEPLGVKLAMLGALT